MKIHKNFNTPFASQPLFMKQGLFFVIVGAMLGAVAVIAQEESSQASTPSEPVVETQPGSGDAAAAPAANGNGNGTEERPSAQILEEEITLRQENTIILNQTLDQGYKLLQAGEFAKATEKFNAVMGRTSPTGTYASLHQSARKGLGMIASRQAQNSEKSRQWGSAQSFWEEALRYEPDNKTYQAGLARVRKLNPTLEDRYPGNQAVSEDFEQKVLEVQRLLFEGDRFLETGQYDRAMLRYNEVRRIDPYNEAVLKRIERVERSKIRALTERNRMQREKAMAEVAKLWNEPPPPRAATNSGVRVTGVSESKISDMMKKLENIRIPELNFTEVDITEAINFLSRQTRELDPEKRGINFVLKLSETPSSATPAPASEGGAPTAEPSPAIRNTVSFSLRNVPLLDVLDIISKTTGLQVKVEESAVFILPATETSDILFVRSFTVDPNFFDGGLPAAGGTSPALDVKQQLTDKGVNFAPGSTASFLSTTSRLVVRGTADMLNLIEQIVNDSRKDLPQVQIETKFLEYTENKLDELRFRWQLNADATIPGTALAPLPTSGPSKFQAESAGLRGINADDLTVQAGVVPNALDAILGTGANRAPGRIEVTGILDGRGARMLIDFLNSNLKADLVSSPKIVLKQNVQGRIRVAREFVYPRTFEPPEIPGNGGGGGSLGTVIPANPTDFNFDDPRYVGVVMNVRVTNINLDTRLIDLEFPLQSGNRPGIEVTDFDGFINYADPVNTLEIIGFGPFLPIFGPTTVAQEAIAIQPVFSVRGVSTALQLRDGQSFVMGGFIREDVQEVNDKVPVLGDLPGLGRLFRSKAKQSIKRNLVIISTATIIRNDGTPQFPAVTEDESETRKVALVQP